MPEPVDFSRPCAHCGIEEGEHRFGDWACPNALPGQGRRFSQQFKFKPKEEKPCKS